MRRAFVFVLLVTSAACAQDPWQIFWSDEFDGPAGAAPEQKKWAYDLGGGGWGNHELEVYTNSTANSFLDGNGHLIIRAIQTASGAYTSARLKTQDRFSFAFGKVEARIKLPFGQGIWPAFWMLGANIASVGWPACGEIDIMENIGKEPAVSHGTLHGPGYQGAGIGAPFTLPVGQKFSDNFHVFAIIWKPDNVEFLVDSKSYFRVARSALTAGQQWVFEHPFFLLLNVAVGGDFPGSPSASTQFPQEMTVDYVRVYRSSAEPVADAIVNSASFIDALAPGTLASVFGTGLAAATHGDLFDSTNQAFPITADGVSIDVNGRPAPLTYISATQINFQVSWATEVGSPVNVSVSRDGTVTNIVGPVLAPTAPSVFSANGAAIVSCSGPDCTLWGNGFGPKAAPQQDGQPASPSPLPSTTNTCSLAIANVPAQVTYCGAAPGLIIDQLNFVFPAKIADGEMLGATLKIGTGLVEFQMPRVGASIRGSL